MVRSVVLGADVFDVISGGLNSAGVIVITPPLLGGLAGRGTLSRSRGDTIRNFATSIGLGLWSVVDDDDFLGETVFVKVIPVWLLRTATFP